MNAKSYLDKVKEIKQLKADIKDRDHTIKYTQDINSALQNENLELENSLKKLLDKLQKGARYIVLRDGYIVNGGELPPEAVLIYDSQLQVNEQELTKGYCILNDNKVIADKNKKDMYLKTFIGGIRL